MSSETQDKNVHELAGGWITERKDTPIPLFLKLAYVGFSAFGFVYLFRYATGEVDHASRGPLVRQMNEVLDKPSEVWIGFLGVVLALFAAGLLVAAFGKGGQEE